MPRPTYSELTSGVQSWDAVLNDNIQVIFDEPFAVFMVTNFGDLPAAGSYDLCIAVIQSEGVLALSRSGSWVRIPYKTTSPTVPASTAVTLAQLVTDFNNLRSALAAAVTLV